MPLAVAVARLATLVSSNNIRKHTQLYAAVCLRNDIKLCSLTLCL